MRQMILVAILCLNLLTICFSGSEGDTRPQNEGSGTEHTIGGHIGGVDGNETAQSGGHEPADNAEGGENGEVENEDDVSSETLVNHENETETEEDKENDTEIEQTHNNTSEEHDSQNIDMADDDSKYENDEENPNNGNETGETEDDDVDGSDGGGVHVGLPGTGETIYNGTNDRKLVYIREQKQQETTPETYKIEILHEGNKFELNLKNNFNIDPNVPTKIMWRTGSDPWGSESSSEEQTEDVDVSNTTETNSSSSRKETDEYEGDIYKYIISYSDRDSSNETNNYENRTAVSRNETFEIPILENVAFYEDVHHGAAIAIRFETKNGVEYGVLNGGFSVDQDRYGLEKAEAREFPDQVVGDIGEPPDPEGQGVPHVVTRLTRSSEGNDGWLESMFDGIRVDIPNTATDQALRFDWASSVNSQMYHDYNMEILLVVDNTVFDKYYREASYQPLEAIRNLKFHYAHIMNSVHMAFQSISPHTHGYKLTLWIKRFDILVQHDDELWTDDVFIETNPEPTKARVKAYDVLLNFQDWVEKYHPDPAGCDAIVLFTLYKLDRSSEIGVAQSDLGGITFEAGVGHHLRQLIVVEDRGVQSWQTLAHQLALNLGAKHDGIDNDCPMASLNIMTPLGSGGLDENLIANAYKFSNCSAAEVFMLISGHSDGYPRVTLTNRLCEHEPAVSGALDEISTLSGVSKSLDEQCAVRMPASDLGGAAAKHCATAVTPEVCGLLYCDRDDVNGCVSMSPGAEDGTDCASDSWCYRGKCVPKGPVRIQRDPECVPTALAQYVPSGCTDNPLSTLFTDAVTTCTALVQASANRCFTETLVRTECCATCHRSGLVPPRTDAYIRPLSELPDTGPTETDECEDIADNCAATSTMCTILKAYMEINCKRTCGLCDTETDPCASSPCRNAGLCSPSGNSYRCTCSGGYSGVDCEIPPVDPCSEQPCQNGGTCSSDGFVGFSCQCAPGYFGVTCTQIEYGPCDSFPCRNGATCQNIGATFRCYCEVGYVGQTCENFAHDPCQSVPCQNGGTCRGIDNIKYECDCGERFYGPMCQFEDGDPCASNPCLQGGQCERVAHKYKCHCPEGFEGYRCQTPRGCVINPCQNGGSCAISNNVQVCTCVDGWRGGLCDLVDHCYQSPCQNGGVCTSSENGYSCECGENYYGATCTIYIDNCVDTPGYDCDPALCGTTQAILDNCRGTCDCAILAQPDQVCNSIDLFPNCAHNRQYCGHIDYGAWMKTYCKKTCGIC